MAKKGQTFQRYSEAFKQKAVKMYLEEGRSYRAVAQELGIRSKAQVQVWVEKYRKKESFLDQRGKTKGNHPFMGRPRTKFQSIEEERDYLKAQVEYLKKRYPNLLEERGSRK